MVKTINVYIEPYDLLEYIKTSVGLNNCKDFVLTDIRIEQDDGIEFKAIVSDEIIDRKESVRYRYE